MNYETFICYRGSSSAGRFLGDKIYQNLTLQKVTNIYFSCAIETSKNAINFINDPKAYLGEVKNFIIILTKDFFDGFLGGDGNINPYSITLIELKEAFNNPNIRFIPIYFSDFSWDGSTNGLNNRLLINSIFKEENANRIIGSAPVHYFPEYEEALYKLVYEKINSHDNKDKTSAIFFDFDGTLTKPNYANNTWLRIWETLNYEDEMCLDLHNKFTSKDITHEEWCTITEKYFKERKLTKQQVIALAKDSELINDVKETLEYFKEKGIKLYIVSGSINTYIKAILDDDTYRLFDEVRCNRFYYDEQDNLDGISGTPFDFEGKSLFVEKIIKDNQFSPENIVFIGNSFNDEFVYKVGCQTICVNPKLTNYSNQTVWNKTILKMTSLKQLLQFIKL